MSDEQTQSSPAPEPKPTTREQTVIGSDTRVKGEMTFDHDCRVLGHFEGSITSEGQLHVAEGATCKAEVEAESVVLDGTVEGNVTARQRVKLNASAKVNGDIVAATLEVADGAQVTGHVSVGPDQQPTQRRSPRQEPEDYDEPEAAPSPPAAGGRRVISHKPGDSIR
jgi:cytoskeletal protein CcmA (bactofilin family)